jgi:hypothetical protein
MEDCQECGYEAKELHTDPRNPPLDTDPCLCTACALGAFDAVADEHKEEMEYALSEIKRLEKIPGEDDRGNEP